MARSRERGGPPRLRERFGPLDLPYLTLGTLPTPVERLAVLSRRLGAEVWVKRDDVSGSLYGGNKVRKLELLLADVLEQGRTRVVTFGAFGSHHCLATALYGQSLGLEVRLALYPQPITPHVLDDLILCHAAGAKLIRLDLAHPLPAAVAVWQHLARPGEIVPPGGSSPLGALGYVEAGLELADQIAAGALPRPDLVFVAAGTCGTVAGLQLGLELAGVSATLVPVRVVPAIITNAFVIRRLRDLALRRLEAAGLPRGAAPGARVEVTLDVEELGAGYGHPTLAAEEARAAFAADGVELETTYTAKAAAALLRWARERGAGKTLLFWNTFSSVDLSARLAAADPAGLPPEFHDVLRTGGRLA